MCQAPTEESESDKFILTVKSRISVHRMFIQIALSQ